MVFERETIKHGEPDEAEEEQTPIEEEDAEDGADEEEEEEEEEEEMVCEKMDLKIIHHCWKGFKYAKNAEDQKNIGQFTSSGQTRDSRTTITKHKQPWIIQDPLETIRQRCEQTAHCMHAQERLEACETRVGSRSHTEEDCTEELFDFLHARDHCVAQKLFNSVK